MDIHGRDPTTALAHSQSYLQARKRHRDSDSANEHVTSPEKKARDTHGGHFNKEPDKSTSRGYLIVHRVECNENGDHAGHESFANFLDIPRLYRGDCKGSTLRGRERIDSIEEYLKTHPKIVVMVRKTYKCHEYYKGVEHEFQPLVMPSNPVIDHIKQFFFLLPRDSGKAFSDTGHIAILSKYLQHAIEQATGINQDLSDFENPVDMKSISHLLYSWQALGANGQGDIEQRHTTALLECLDEAFGHEYREADRLFARQRVTREHLAKLFHPNEIVVATQDGEKQGYMVKSCPRSAQLPIRLQCTSWEFDGLFRQVETELSVEWPSSETELSFSDLEIYPIRGDTSDLAGYLRRRGEAIWRCRKRMYISYESPDTNSQMNTSKPRYMIDMNTYREMHDEPHDRPQRDDLGVDTMNNDQPPGDPFLLLLPTRIHGFGFHDKKWRSLLADHIHPIDWNTRAFDRLVIHPDNRELIRALVTVHTSSSRSADVIEGKGNGLIILLHGGPGTGKTLTAESVAEITQKPLYRITCGDIGTNAEEVEKYLQTVLYIGTIWGCVVLLDEADVFLEERQTQDMQRNALVSVFLRVLEYYDGILILTSNRIGIFDDAFRSRIQLTLHYPPLSERDRREIWSNFISGLREQGTDANIDDLMNKINVLAWHELNGREIRNTVSMAKQLAEYHRQPLEYSHFQKVIRISEEFIKYLKDVHNHTESDWAREQMLRRE